jgi:hypothetical protein
MLWWRLRCHSVVAAANPPLLELRRSSANLTRSTAAHAIQLAAKIRLSVSNIAVLARRYN